MYPITAIFGVRPRYFLGENVPNLFKHFKFQLRYGKPKAFFGWCDKFAVGRISRKYTILWKLRRKSTNLGHSITEKPISNATHGRWSLAYSTNTLKSQQIFRFKNTWNSLYARWIQINKCRRK